MRVILSCCCLALLAGGCKNLFPKEQPTTSPATAPAGPEYPDDPSVAPQLRQLAKIDHVALLEEALTVYRTTPVRDYTCTFAKQERIDGDLGKRQVTRVRFLAKPFAVAMMWTENPPRGDALIYVSGWWKSKDGKSQMLVRPTSSFLRALVGGSILRDPEGPDATKASLKPVTAFGLESMIQNLLDVYRQALDRGECQMRYDGVSTVGDRKCIVLLRLLPPDKGYPAERTKTYLDVETLMPLRVIGHDLQGRLLVDYTFTDVQYNVGLMLADFVPQANGIDPPKDLNTPDLGQESSPDENLAKPADVFEPADLNRYLQGRDAPAMTDQPATQPTSPQAEPAETPEPAPAPANVDPTPADDDPVTIIAEVPTSKPGDASTQPVDQPASLPAVIASPLASSDTRPTSAEPSTESAELPALRPAAVTTSQRRGADLIPPSQADPVEIPPPVEVIAQEPAPADPTPSIPPVEVDETPSAGDVIEKQPAAAEPAPTPAITSAQPTPAPELTSPPTATPVSTETPPAAPAETIGPTRPVAPLAPDRPASANLPGNVGVFCKLHIVRVADGDVLASANSIAMSRNLRQMARRSVGRLKTAINDPGKPIAVLQLRHDADTPAGAELAAALAEEITLALIDGQTIDVVEWIPLEGLAPAEQWDTPAIVNRTAIRDELQDVTYVIVGSIRAAGR